MNNIEKKLKKRGIQKLNKYAKNPYHVAWFKRIPTWMKVAIPSLAVATATAVVCFAVILPMFGTKNYSANLNKGDNYAPAAPSGTPTSYYQGSNQEQTPHDSGAYIKPWDERTIEEKYPVFKISLDSHEYFYGWYHHNPIEAQYVDEKIADDVTVKGNDPYNNIDYQTTISLYRIKDFASRLVVAVKFNEDEHYYCYGNRSEIDPYPTLAELLVDLPLDKIATFDKAYFGYEESGNRVSDEYSGVTTENVMNILFGDKTKQNIKSLSNDILYTVKGYTKVIQISTPFPSIDITSGTGSSALTLYNTGFMQATMLNRQHVFYVGTEVYQNFENYLTNNLTGTRQSSYFAFSVPHL